MIDYSKKSFIWGRPVAVSNNGLIFIFKINQARVIHILKLNPKEEYGFTEIKKIDIRNAIMEQIKFEAKSDDPSDRDEVKAKYCLRKGELFSNLLDEKAFLYKN